MAVRDPKVWLGTASIDPAGDVEAGSFGSWTISYRVGRYGVDNSGSIKIAIRMVTDWGNPQLEDPAAEGYTTVTHTGAAKLRARFEPHGGVRPWSRVLLLEVYDGSLAEGDTVTVVWGDRRGGSPGCRAQTYPEDGFEFRVLVDCFGTGMYERLPSSPRVPVVPGPATQLVLVAPSWAVVGEPTWLLVRAQDRWGNATPRFTGTVRLSGADGWPERFTFTAEMGGVQRFEGVRFAEPGVRRVVAEADGSPGLGPPAQKTQNTQNSSSHGPISSNPVVVHPHPPAHRLLWGDTQGQSGATVGTGGLEAFFRYARDVAALDFVVHSGNDFQITREHWEETREHVRRFHEPGRFVTFLSYEWSGNTPAGGDHNVVYLGDDGPLHRSSHWQLEDRSDEHTDRYPVRELWRELRGRTDVIGIPHVGGRRADFDFYDPEFCPVVEISSVHGRFEWFAREALGRGLRVGFVGATDDHSGRPGASPPTAGGQLPVQGGLAAVYAAENTREAIFEALKARRCYATTGERIVLEVEADGHPMGAEYRADRPSTLTVRAIGVGPLEKVEILRGEAVVHTHQVAPVGDRLRIAWMGARVDTRGRYTRWNGGLTLSAGRILSARPWAFDCPADSLEQVGEREVRWRSGTSGDPDGVLLDLDAPADAEIAFRAGPAEFTFRPSEVNAHPLVIECGGLEQQVAVDRAPEDGGPSEAQFTWQDPAPLPGVQPYWVRVTQLDSHTAWSSPVFVEVSR